MAAGNTLDFPLRMPITADGQLASSEFLRFLIEAITRMGGAVAPTNKELAFVTTATTLAGYGITDAAPLSHVGTGGNQHLDVVAAGASGFMNGTDKTKLNGIAAGATANQTDAYLLARANHTGTQAFATLTATPTTLAGYGISDGATAAALALKANITPTGGTVTQATSKAAGVTLNKESGQITTAADALAAATTVSFTLTDSAIGANDLLVVNRKSGGTAAAYQVWCDASAAGSASISIRNTTAGSLSEALVLQYKVLTGAVV